MHAHRCLFIALCLISGSALAAQKPEAKKPLKKVAKPLTTSKELSNKNPQQIKEQIAILKARLAKMDNSGNEPQTTNKWYQHFALSALVNVDGAYHTRPYFGVGNRETATSQFFGLGTANIAGSAHFGNWLSGRVSVLYQNSKSPAVRNSDTYIGAYKHVVFDQAYITLANFARTPYFFRIGQEYAPFGRYQRYPMTNTLPQVLSQTNAPIAQFGFVTENGFYGSLYALNGVHKFNRSKGAHIENGGFTIGFKKMIKQMSFDIGVAYLINMSDVDAIRTIIKDKDGYRDKVPAISAYINVFAGPFEIGVQQVAATKRFDVSEYAYNVSSTVQEGAKPSAGKVNAEYSFLTFTHHSNLNVSYQWSSEAHNTAVDVLPTDPTALPKRRISVTYGVNLVKHLAGYFQVYRDYDYNRNHGGTDKQDNVFMLRMSLMM